MPRTKGSKNKAKATKAKKEPASTPETTDFQPPFTGKEDDAAPLPELREEVKAQVSTGGTLDEGETPKRKAITTKKEGPCATCNHGSEMHYGTSERWCNVRKCVCQAYQ